MATSNGSLVAVTGVVLQLLFLFTFSRGQGPGTVDPVRLQVRENVAIGSTVGDIPTLPNYTYVLSENPGNLFSLNPNTGILKTASNIDRENLPTENPVKIVILSSSPIYFIDVFVEVLDENDNSPVFPQRSIAIEYSEAAASGTQAVLRTATDPDLGLNSVTSQYTIVSGNEDNKFRLVVFSEASQPFLYVENLVTLDREEKDFYQLNISAQDGGSPPRSGFLLVNITITDINDTPPVFDQSDYAARVNESAPAGTTVIQVRATDRDMGSNGDITYSVVDDTVQFAIDPKTGVLTTLQKLQCTARCATCNNSCIVTVEARDNGQPQALQGRAYVTVSLIDENDHDPVISFKYIPQTAKMASVSESVPKDSIVAFVSVSDKDQGVNQNTYVRIIHGNELNHFYMVSPIPGLHLVRVNGSLDRERIKVYNLTILAQDGGSPPRSSTAHLIIHVSDENDHPPVFEKTNYVVNLSELAPVGSFVAGLTATDNDTDINAHITYTIVSGNQQQWFRLDRNSGLITTQRPLDHETVSQITMNISAQDGGSQPFISFASLKVYIQDENDEVPQFEEQIIHASLVEGTVSASLVTVLTATDRDSGSNGSVQYVFAPSVNSQYPQTFSLSPTTGRLETTKVLDRETVPFYTLHVIARDGGTPPLSATATVYLNVTDINDNSPEFYPKRYYTTVREGMPPPVQVQQVTATDLDEGTNALVRYAIENGNVGGKFTIDAVSGDISTTQELRQSQGTRYNLTVSTYEVANPSVKHFATVLVSVTVPGSSGPQFSTASYSFTIMEDTGDQFVPRNVGQVRVTGSATGVTFEIADGDPEGVFSIGQSTGNIITAKILDREMQPFYTLKVIASDGTLFSESTVHVTVTDANDNAPQFPANRVEVSMPEKLQVGHKVYRAEAIDVDYGSNSELSYILTSDANGTFSIGQSTGVIELEKPVSWTRGGVNSFTVHVTVRDKGLPQRSSSMEVTINVIDVNDHTPSFQQSSYEIAVSEALPVNHRFFQVTATDADGGQNGEVVYNITRGGTAFFKIFPDGVLYIAQQLDRETQEIYHLTIKAEDRGIPARSSFVNVTIHVRDDNDNPPQFTNSSYVMQVYENSEAGTYIGSVSATDRDTDRNAELFYFISSDQTDFSINPTTGAISTLRSFDREEVRRQFLRDYVMFEVTVIDNGLHRLRDTATVEVRIIDRNDNAPVFTHILYEATVFESAAVTTLVQKVIANDQDQGVNGQVSYSIESGNEDGVFSLDPGTGDIKVAGQLDRETNATYMLIVNAEDSADSPSFTATATVRITVLDANDNSPQFIHTELRADISEMATPGEFITQFSATDADILNNAAIQFSIASGNADNTFNLDATSGKLYLQKKLDYEDTPQYLLEIMASDRGSPSRDTTVIFVVSVQDSNDNSPQFSTQPAVFHVAENNNPNIPVAVLTATDLDSGTNGEIRYSILHQDPVGDYFDINPTSGQIIAKKRIDRELIGRFNLTVKGTDQAIPVNTRRSSLKTVTILVDDVNDNTPVFTSLTATAVSALAQAGSQVMHVRAEDPDAGPNGVVSYTLSGGDTNLFTLQSNTGVLLLKSSIPSSGLKYSVSVTATDSGTPRLSSTSTIDIIIKATTENGPAFTGNTPYSGSVYENQTPGTTVSVQVQASSPGAQVEYYITGITSSGQQMPRYFAIDRQTGVVTTAVSLDYDLGQHSFSVEVYAIDVSGSTRKARKTQVSITLLDQNDTPPSFGSSLYEVDVPEDVQPGYVVASLVAQDVDSEGTVTYRISSGDLSVFQVNGNTGVLTTRVALDRETTPSYSLTVEASDGVQTASTTVMVTVTDVNDNPPRFTQSVYSFDIREDAFVSSTVARITATDADKGLNGEITYYLQADNWGSSVFALDRRLGVFTLQQPLDFETTQIYTLTVFAEDAGISANLSSSAVVYMNVKDTNDNAPVFDPSTYSVEVFENVTVGTSIVTVSASDTDTGTNGEIVYSIVSGDPIGQFRIDPKNGTIFSSLPLDRETMPFYTLTVEASDMAEYPNNRLQGTTQVSVILKDVNDNAPVFTTRNETWVSENMPVGTTIMKITALDPDAERNSYVAYHLTSNMFSLGPGDGLLKVSGNLDRETKDTYVLDITATDKGQPPRSSHQTITVHIRDKNDNNPVFDPREYRATVSENAAIGTPLKQVSATDRDAGLNGETRYFIFSGDSNGDFKMDSHTGELSVQKKLNYERVRSYTLQIRAEDGGIEPRYDTATVTVEVTDVNDNTPTFRDSPYIAYVQEGVPASDLPVFVYKVEAYDADSPPNNQITYRLLQGVGDIFRLDTQTGLVTATRTLDRETRDQYELVITAYDSGSPQLTGTGKITVIVQDVNDHTPTFVRTHYAVSIRENLPPNTPVEQVYAVDYDTGNNAAITYHIQGFPGNPFAIHPVSGQIVTMETLDREEQEAYTLVVVATDGGIVPRSSTATVSVQVIDVNDNSPQFEKDLFSYYMRDPTTSADFVAGVTAIDKDVGSNGQIVYSLSDDPDTIYFNIDPQTGVLTTKDGLMASSFPRGLRFSVIASDQGQPRRMDIAEVQLTFQSSPLSQYPTFSSSARQFSQSENTPVGNTITTVSATAPSRQGITYHIAAGNIRKTFAIGQTLGNVTLMRPLDYEAVTGYSLWIEARDGSQQPLSSYIKLSITVTDVNDNSPVFERFVYNVSILESNPQGGEVVLDSLSATDADSGPNGQVTYSIVSGNVGNIFSINPTSGRLSTLDSLDREQVDHYVLVIQAADQGTPPRTAQTTVDVTVADKNDNPPQFTKIFRGTIQENANVGAFVMRMTSSDPDIGANAIARYSLKVNPDNKFAIDEISGNVTVAGALDRETNDSYTLTVEAVDGSWSTTTRVTITIEDQNDNAPQFSDQPYSFNFKELQRQGSPVGTVTATDRDETGPNSMVQYSLKQISEFFDINADSGSIFSKQPLTFDPASLASNRHQLIVVASDQGVPRRSTEVVVTVNIEDANNNAPVFNKTSYFTPVPDNTSVRTRVVRTEAVDSLDYGVNAEVGYQSLPGYNGTSFFTVDASTGWISVAQSLTGQRNRDFVVVIRATDKGTPPQSADVTVHFSVTDVNRNTPRFNSTTFRATIPENRRVGNVVASVFAQDDDQGINGQVGYHITGGDPQGWFAIGETSGMVTIAKPLDYDTTPVINLTITAKDKGLISKQASVAFIIQLTDINDNPPVFNQSAYDTYILENSPRGSTVFVALASDADSNAYADVEYRLEGGAGFTINAETGVIRTQTDLDYETKKLYTMVVRATNPGTSLESTAVLNVHVTGANEDYPKFTRRRYEFIVSESARPGQQVGAVTALDSDQGTEGVVYYFLVGSSNRKGFKIDSLRGTIIVETPLDREVMSSVTLTVMAKNPGSVRGNDTDTCTVYISLEDANDPPLFTDTEYTGNVREDAGAGQNVVRVSASDNDLQTSDRQFSYSIESGNDGGAFSVEPVSGWVRTTGARLDRETLPVYNITVVAIDTGSPPQTGSTNVIISLDDVNDNGPVFQPQNLTAYVTEEQDPQQAPVVIQLDSHTTDPDLPPNQGPYTYSLVPNQYSSYFQLQSSNGALRTTRSIDREQISDLDLLIKVTDGGSPQQTSTLTLHVLVNDLNDNPPTPRPLTVSVFAYQGNFPGGLVADVTPNDPDISGSYTCSILQGDRSMFSFSGSNCQLQANLVQSPKDFTLNISSSDGRSSGVTSATLVKFRTVDNTTLENTLVVRLQSLTQETFLRTFRTRFESTLAQYLTSGDSIVLHNLLQRGPNLDLFLAIQQSSGQYRAAATLENTLQSNMNSIQQGSGVIIATINVSPCQSNPCQNNGVCSDDPVVFSTYNQMSSLSYILTAPAVQHNHHCQCPAGFTGTNCELDIGQSCGNNVCSHGGTCLDIDGTPTCTCVAGYTGPTCGDDVNECLSNPCPGSECRNTVGSYRCELTGRGFHGLSYMEFQSPLQRDQNNIVLEFATLQQNALLLYNPGSTDFLALEIVAGRVVFSFNLGETDSTKLTVGQYVSNGKWYKVTVSRIQEAGTLKVQLCDPVCRQCNVGDSNCYATGSHDGFQTLDVASGNLSLGGVRDFDLLLQRKEVQTYDFVGCLRIAVADGYNLLTGKEKLRASVGVTNTCPRENTGTCTSNVCENGGTCKDEWFGMSCTCRSGFMGDRCELELKSFTFGPNAKVEFIPKESYRRESLLSAAAKRRKRAVGTGSHSMSVTFGTSTDGPLFQSTSPSGYTLLGVEEGKLVYQFQEGGTNEKVTVSDQKMDNNVWHNISLSVQGNKVQLKLNEEPSVDREFPAVHDFLGLDVTALKLGGKFPDKSEEPGFAGCLSDFLLNGEEQPFQGATDRFDVQVSGNTSNGCSTGVIGCNACASGGVCSEQCGAIKATGTPPPISIGVIIVIVFLAVLILGLLITFIVFRARRTMQQKKQHSAEMTKQNGDSVFIVNKAANDSNRTQDSGYTETGEVPEETIIRNHIAEELATKSFQEREISDHMGGLQPPDILGRQTSTVPSQNHQDDGTVIIENGDAFGMPEEALPEHYDIENASSIAPSDIDVITHYRRYRDGKRPHHQRNNHHVPTYHKHSHRHSPNHILNRTARDSPMNQINMSLPRQSPSVMMQQQQQQQARDSPNAMKMQSTPMPRQSPLTVNNPLLRQSPINPMVARHSPMNQLSRTSPIRDMRVSPLGMQLGNRVASPIQEVRVDSDQSSGHGEVVRSPTNIPPRPHSRMQQPGGVASRPPMGLTVEEIERLNARQHVSPTSTIDAVSSTTEGRGRPNNINTLEHSGLLEPPESTSDDSSNDSFTCSEFEYENERNRPEFDQFPKLSEAENENEDSPQDSNGRTFTYDGSDSVRGSLSTLLVSEDETLPRPTKSPTGLFNWDYLLNWGPSFEKLVGVFQDIAALPDSEGRSDVKLVPLDVKKDMEEYV